MKYSDVIVQPLLGDKWKLEKDVTYKGITVEKGFRTNGADIPRFLWSLIPPNKSDLIPAIIFHDSLCEQCKYKLADEIFEDILKDLHVHKITIRVLVSGVKTWHYIAYTKYDKDRIWLKYYNKITNKKVKPCK